MNESFRRILFVALLAVVLLQTGAHLSQSFVNYPAWGFIDRGSFPAYHRVITAGAMLFLMIPRVVEIVLAIIVVRFRPPAIERWMFVLGIGLTLGALLCTVFVQRPIHVQLETVGNTPALLSQLRITDRIRLVLEILRAALYLRMLSLVVSSRSDCSPRQVDHAHLFEGRVPSASNTHVAEHGIQQAVPMSAVRYAVIDQQSDDYGAGIVGTVGISLGESRQTACVALHARPGLAAV